MTGPTTQAGRLHPEVWAATYAAAWLAIDHEDSCTPEEEAEYASARADDACQALSDLLDRRASGDPSTARPGPPRGFWKKFDSFAFMLEDMKDNAGLEHAETLAGMKTFLREIERVIRARVKETPPHA